jgi:translation initiation factor IF-1
VLIYSSVASMLNMFEFRHFKEHIIIINHIVPVQNNRRKKRVVKEKDDKIYFDKGVVIETLPGTMFKVRVDRLSKTGEALPPIIVVCHLKSQLVKAKVKVIRADSVKIEVSPEDMYFNAETGVLKGTIVQRHLEFNNN